MAASNAAIISPIAPWSAPPLIAVAGNVKYETAWALAYATGLRISEVVTWKVGDIDGERVTRG